MTQECLVNMSAYPKGCSRLPHFQGDLELREERRVPWQRPSIRRRNVRQRYFRG
mgnify:FL=1